MIEFGKITGKVRNNFLQVKIRTGENFYAPMAIMGTTVSLPSEEWINNNKENFLALITYEKDIYENPIILGFFPVKGAESNIYNTHELLLGVIERLLDILKTARINTQIGPQKFMPDSQIEFDNLTEDISKTKKLINAIRL